MMCEAAGESDVEQTPGPAITTTGQSCLDWQDVSQVL